jgi:hypothetical protein
MPVYEMRIEARETGGPKPDYSLLHSTMADIAAYQYPPETFTRELPAIYRMLSSTPIEEVERLVAEKLDTLPFRTKYEIFLVSAIRRGSRNGRDAVSLLASMLGT